MTWESAPEVDTATLCTWRLSPDPSRRNSSCKPSFLPLSTTSNQTSSSYPFLVLDPRSWCWRPGPVPGLCEPLLFPRPFFCSNSNDFVSSCLLLLFLGRRKAGMMVAMTRGSLTVSRRSNHPRSRKPSNKKQKKKKKKACGNWCNQYTKLSMCLIFFFSWIRLQSAFPGSFVLLQII